MKLAFICTEMLPSPAVKGGAIQMMIDGVVPFLKENHSVTVFSVTDPDLPDREVCDGVEYIRFPKENYESSIAEELKNQLPFDVVHVCNRPANILQYKQAAPDSKFVLSLHNEMFRPKKISDESGKAVIEALSGISTVSNYIKETVINRFPEAEEKIQIVYSGVDLTQYPPVWTPEGQAIRKEIRNRYKIDHRKVILFVGRLSKNKGPHLLIQAMKDVLQKHPDAVLVITGGKWFSDDGMNNYIRSLYRMSKPFGNRVIFTKFIPAGEISKLFLAADVFVCPSQWQEPLARVHYEAMAAGIPVVTTNTGGNAEVILNQENGLLINNFRNPKNYVRAIHFIFSQPELARWMAKNGRTFVELDFQFSHVAERLERLYSKTLEGLDKST
jgi:glycosyltransferase involved in cell wall biosynthesis